MGRVMAICKQESYLPHIAQAQDMDKLITTGLNQVAQI